VKWKKITTLHMMLNQVTRTYSRSINTKNYGVPESWIKIEATYTAECESGDDPVKVSKMLYDQSKADVLGNIKEITDAIAASRAVAPAAPAPAPVATGPVQAAPFPAAPAQLPTQNFNQAPRQL
jgi:hypothetical protein